MGQEAEFRGSRAGFSGLTARQSPLCLRHEGIDELCCGEIADQWRGLARPKRHKRRTRRIAVCLEERPLTTNVS